MKAWVRYFSIILVLALSILACSTEMQGTPTPASGDVLFADNFSNPNSGWDRIQDSGGSIDYLNGKYRMMVNTADTDVWANPGKKFGDVSVQVNAAKVGGTDNNDYGVICRYQDSTIYFFVISSDGYYDRRRKMVNSLMVKWRRYAALNISARVVGLNAIQADVSALHCLYRSMER
jgi:hypothetical protein